LLLKTVSFAAEEAVRLLVVTVPEVALKGRFALLSARNTLLTLLTT
jgi:hypothetical protein